ncbi:apoptosis-stimulating of p53 protein 2 [Sabethes cyaneus]|uniref:apoptosis-stimulating of p53 protein 2 n=1 Tax=Sabethes cyaneus TaxID=53552 RepID=UPI00237EC735|nr:apoptosis-stimulating of p53 protein 2 [Sabethes cyaneus]
MAPIRLNTSELRMMALRQQQQIDTQQQLLAAREQRLRFLKAQEACEVVAVAEGERLRRLRERVEAQESKLRRLRALRGQVDLQKNYNVTLGTDLDSIRALFSEKEKELTLAVAKVEALTRQLEDLKRGQRGTINLFSGTPSHSLQNNSATTIELEKLRRELMYRNQLSLQQDARLNLQREALQKRQAELQSVDQRILELQGRLHKKRISNIITQHQSLSCQTTLMDNMCTNYVRSISSNFYPQLRMPRNNIVAVEPFCHIPQKTVASCNSGNKINILNNATQTEMCPVSANISTDTNLAAESDESKLAAKQKREETLKKNIQHDCDESLNAFTKASKAAHPVYSENDDKRAVDREMSHGENAEGNVHYSNHNNDTDNGNLIARQADTNECDNDKDIIHTSATVHSTPLSFINKSVAVPVTVINTTSSAEKQNPPSKPTIKSCWDFSHNQYHNIPSGNLVVPPRKPNNKILDMRANNTSILKINKVMPQSQPTLMNSSQTAEKLKPALPPKPSRKSAPSSLSNDIESCTNDGNNSELNDLFINKSVSTNCPDYLPIKAKPLTIKKSPNYEQPKLKHSNHKVVGATNNRTADTQPSDDIRRPLINDFEKYDDTIMQFDDNSNKTNDVEPTNNENIIELSDDFSENFQDKCVDEVSRRKRGFSSVLINNSKIKMARRVSFDPLALLLDASLEGELELVQKTALQVPNPSAANDEGITALHNAICAGHFEIVKFLVSFGCDVNAQDSDGWTPLHCAASCNNLAMVKYLVESGACIFAATLSDHETPAEKCEEDEEGFDGCSEYLYSIQEKLGILNNGEVFAVFSYDAQQSDELNFSVNDKLTIIRKGDESEREWWWAKHSKGAEGYIPRNLLGFCPRVSSAYEKHHE